MPTSFSPRFVDLVRCTSSTTGTGNFVPGAAVAGFTSFAANLTVGERFYYSIAGIDKPAEAEVGRGTLMADGSIAREAIVGALFNFSIGQKTVSLVAGAEWFRKASAGAVDMAGVATRAKSDLGAAINELAGLTPLFSEIGATRIPTTVRRIMTAGRTSVGVAPAAYVRDPDQSVLTTIGQERVDALAVGERVAAASAVAAILDRVRTKDADGQYWVIDDEGQTVHAGHFGAIADGWFSFAGEIAGTDNFAAIQALIDWRAYLKQYAPSGSRECLLPAGAFRINNGLQLGYGDTYRNLVLRGAGPGFGGSGGSVLICDFDDRPGIVIQGGRNSFAADLSLVSPRGLGYFYSKELGAYANSAQSSFGIDDRDLTSWFDPARPTMSPYLRFNPHAAIAVDPYRGAKPGAAAVWAPGLAIASGEYRTANGKLYIAKLAGTSAASGSGPSATTDFIADNNLVWAYVGPANLSTSYPNAIIPAFLSPAQRATYRADKAFSSNVPLSNVRMYGFTVGVAVQPCNDDGNGDFVDLNNCEISYAAIQLSVGNTQSRNVNAYRLTGSNFHTAVATNKHGRQNGKLGGIFQNCSWSGCYQLIDIGATAIVGPHTFKQCYIEDFQRIGDVYSFGTASGTAIIFEACQFGFRHDSGNGMRGVPLSLLGNRLVPAGAGSNSSTFVFRDCILGGFKGVASLAVEGVRLENTTLQEDDQYTVPAQWRARAYNTLAGGLVVPRLGPAHPQLIHYTGVNETSLIANGQFLTTRGNRNSSRDLPSSIYTHSLCSANAQSADEIVNPNSISVIDKASQFTGMSLSGRILNFVVTGSPAEVTAWGFVPGGVIVDFATGMTFFIKTRGAGLAMTAELQNGYRYSAAGVIDYVLPFVANASYFVVAGGGVFTPAYPMFANLSSTSPVLASCQRADGYGGFINAGAASAVQVGDLPYADQLADPTFNSGLTVTAVGAGTITLNSVPGVTATQKRLPLWVRGS